MNASAPCAEEARNILKNISAWTGPGRPLKRIFHEIRTRICHTCLQGFAVPGGLHPLLKGADLSLSGDSVHIDSQRVYQGAGRKLRHPPSRAGGKERD